jgi:hypothetical protein
MKTRFLSFSLLSAFLSIGAVALTANSADAFCVLSTYDIPGVPTCNYWELPGYPGSDVDSSDGNSSDLGNPLDDSDYRALYDAAEQLPPEEQAAIADDILSSLYSACIEGENSTQNCQCLVSDMRDSYSDFRLIYIAIYNDYYIGLGRDAHPYLERAFRRCGLSI